MASVQTRPIDISFNFSVPSLLFIRLPKWYALMRFNTPEQITAGLKDADTRAALVAEAQGHDASMEPLGLTPGTVRGQSGLRG